MSLYFEAVRFLGQSNSSLKSRVFADKNLKSQPNQIYALVAESAKWSTVLKEVIENSSLLSLERKLTPELALLLVHDLLLSKRGIAAPSSHRLRSAIEKNKARLQAELTKARIRRKCSTLEDLRALVNSADLSVSSTTIDGGRPASADTAPLFDHARWVRINRLKSTLEEQLSSTFVAYQQVDEVKKVLARSRPASEQLVHVDKHIPDLIALPPNTDLSKERAYLDGKLIIQDKASCFPAYLLDPKPEDGVVVDGCAAPGNKTTHLASLRFTASKDFGNQQIVACERDKSRAGVLQKMVKIAGAESIVTVRAGQDFLRADPNSEPWCSVGALLLDPSCSGSGIVGRDEQTRAVILPSLPIEQSLKSKKRKREEAKPTYHDTEEIAEEKVEESLSKERLQALSAFQTKLVLHALTFPAARKVTYSTCSVHDEENEHVVAAVLSSDIAKTNGWRFLRREEQVDGMKRWHLRGNQSRTESLNVDADMAEACIRCAKQTPDGTQGFFVAGFVRDAVGVTTVQGDEDEWSGFDD